jgi:hypothetical protein
MHVDLRQPSAVTGGPSGGSGGPASGSRPCSHPVRRPGKGSGGPVPCGVAMGAAPAAEVAPSGRLWGRRRPGSNPQGRPRGGASGRGRTRGGHGSGTGGQGRALGGGHGGGAGNRGRVVEGSGVRGEEQLRWIRGEDDLERIHGGAGAHPLSLVVKRSCFGSDPIAYGEEKRLKGILVGSGGKIDLE